MSRDESTIGIRNGTLHLARRRLATAHGEFDVHFFRDLAHGRTAMAIVCGDPRIASPLLVRVHSSCLTSECLMGCDCDCAEQLEGALATMARKGRGVLFYLMQEGRGAGLTAKARDRMIVQASGNRVTTFEAYAEMGLPPDLRRYDEIAPMARLLGIRAPLRLLTNNPQKAAAVEHVLADEKIEILGIEPIQGPTSPFNSDYLSAKHASGHALDRHTRLAGALPPIPVQVIEPLELPGEPGRVVTASYFLPIELPRRGDREAAEIEVEWFRLSVLFERASARESILLSLGEEGLVETEATERIRMTLFDRLPGRPAEGRLALRRALIGLRDRGCGAVAVDFDESDDVDR